MTTKAQPKEVAPKPKAVAVVAPITVFANYTTTYVPTTQVTALPIKIKTTNPVVGKAKY